MTDEEIIKRILAGDETVLKEVSRWDIKLLHDTGRLDKASKEMKERIWLEVIDSCRESY